MPANLATQITSEIPLPRIGIGAGNVTDAQVLVWSDLFWLTPEAPKLAKAYRNLPTEVSAGMDE